MKIPNLSLIKLWNCMKNCGFGSWSSPWSSSLLPTRRDCCGIRKLQISWPLLQLSISNTYFTWWEPQNSLRSALLPTWFLLAWQSWKLSAVGWWPRILTTLSKTRKNKSVRATPCMNNKIRINIKNSFLVSQIRKTKISSPSQAKFI